MVERLSSDIVPVNLRSFDKTKSAQQDLSLSVPKEVPVQGDETKDHEIHLESDLDLVNHNLPSDTLEHSLPCSFPEIVPQPKDLFTSNEKGKLELNIGGKSLLSFKLNGEDTTSPKIKLDSPFLRDFAERSILEPLKNDYQNLPTTGKALVLIAGMVTGRTLGLSVPIQVPDLTVGDTTLETSIRTDLKKNASANFTYGNVSLSIDTQRSFNINYSVPLDGK